ncbi:MULTISPECIES: hypothetical protein [Pseudomonas]|uniref:hypothetical protein n=1 Tax=Pseudomonas TaxID=286 RepID=UPI0013A72FAA|nr:hypothetical protein [Pseudomonas sp. OIL-1]QIB51517.1 hypothetical protein G3M63_10935 [Pseudomonas sp. OIL-1]
MHPLVEATHQITRGYRKKGGKNNRRQQHARMIKFAQFCASEDLNSPQQIGARQVIRYWRTERMMRLADKTLENHHYALVILWELCGKPGTPPKPFMKAEREQRSQS